MKGKCFKNPTLDGVPVAKTDILVIMDSGEKRGQKAKSESALMDNKCRPTHCNVHKRNISLVSWRGASY